MKYALLPLILIGCITEPQVSQWQPIPNLTAPKYGGRTLGDVQRCINWYPEKTDDGWVMQFTPGLQLFGTVTNNAACRGYLYSTNGELYSVHGTKLYKSFLDVFTVVEIGTVSASGRVEFAENLTQIMVLVNGTGYIITKATDAIAAIADTTFTALSPVGLTCQDGYFIVANSGTNEVHLSQVDDGTDWTPALNDGAVNSSDLLIACVSNGQFLFLFGTQTIETWYNTGNSGFPFEAVTGATVRFGLMDQSTIAQNGSRICFVASGGGARASVWCFDGSSKEKISTPYIDSRIGAWASTIGSPANMFADAWADEGHEFYSITNKTSGETWVYDFTVGAWHARSTTSLNYFRGRITNSFNDVVNNARRPVALDVANGKIYFVDPGYNSEDGTAITRVLDFKIDAGITRASCYGLRFELEIDHDSSTSYTLSPTLTWSDDAGASFSTGFTLSKAITSGTTAQQVILTTPPLGMIKAGRIFRLTFAGPAARIILRRAEALLEKGRF